MLVYRLDTASVGRLAAALAELSTTQQAQVTTQVLNDIGDSAYTGVVRTLSEETGAQQKRVRGTMRKKRAYADHPQFEIIARDQFMSLKDFRPAQRKAGVQASPWGDRTIFPHTFFGPGGHVYKRTGADRLPIEKLWGPSIPRELLRGKTNEVVYTIAGERLPRRLEYYLDKQLGRVKTRYKV